MSGSSGARGSEVVVNASKCMSYGMCVGIAPELFDLPDDAPSVVLLRRTIADDEHDDVEEAVRCCPAGAIALRVL